MSNLGAGEQSGSEVEMANSSINALTLVVSWVLSTVTTLIIIGIFIGVRRCQRSAKRKRRFSEQPINLRESMKSDRSAITSISQINNNSFHKGQGQGQTSRQVSLESDLLQAGQATHSRRRRDDVLKWCNAHNLSEKIADCLRDAGFLTYEILDTLRVEDIGNLDLPNKGMQCMLRESLERNQAQKDRINSSSSTASLQPILKPQHVSNRLNSSSSVVPPGAADPLLPYSSNADDVPDGLIITGKTRRRNSGHRTKHSMEGMEIISDSSAPRSPQRNPLPVRTSSDPHGFKGMLADHGLHEISTELGREWLHLASLLGVKSAKQEHIRMDNPNNTQMQIFEMLKHWRNTSKGRKEQLKGALHKALTLVHRTDIADRLLAEQTAGGSVERINGNTSLI